MSKGASQPAPAPPKGGRRRRKVARTKVQDGACSCEKVARHALASIDFRLDALVSIDFRLDEACKTLHSFQNPLCMDRDSNPGQQLPRTTHGQVGRLLYYPYTIHAKPRENCFFQSSILRQLQFNPLATFCTRALAFCPCSPRAREAASMCCQHGRALSGAQLTPGWVGSRVLSRCRAATADGAVSYTQASTAEAASRFSHFHLPISMPITQPATHFGMRSVLCGETQHEQTTRQSGAAAAVPVANSPAHAHAVCASGHRRTCHMSSAVHASAADALACLARGSLIRGSRCASALRPLGTCATHTVAGMRSNLQSQIESERYTPTTLKARHGGFTSCAPRVLLMGAAVATAVRIDPYGSSRWIGVRVA